MPTGFPTSLDDFTNPIATEVLGTAAGGIGIAASITNLNDAVEAVQAKVGIDNSAVTTSLDYLLKNTGSSDPGHKHTSASLPDLVTLDTAQTISGVKTFSATPKMDAIAEATTNAGVTVDGLLIKAGNAARATVLSTTAKAKAKRTSNQTGISAGAYTKIQLNVEDYDPGGNFDNATNYRFTAPVAGYYFVTLNLLAIDLTDGQRYEATLFRNLGRISAGEGLSPTSSGSAILGVTCTDIVYLAAGDFLEFYTVGTASFTVYSDVEASTFMTVHLIST